MSIPQAVRALGRLALAIVPLWLIGSLVLSPSLPIPVRAVFAAVSVLALISPVEALIVVALMTPLGEFIGISMEASIRVAEALVVAFLAGWLLRPVLIHKPGPSPTVPVKYAAWGFAAIVLGSIAVQALHLRRTNPAAWMAASSFLEHAYFNVTSDDPIGAINGARLIEGLGLSAAVVVLLRRKPMLAVWLPEALGAGCAVAAAVLTALVAGNRLSRGSRATCTHRLPGRRACLGPQRGRIVFRVDSVSRRRHGGPRARLEADWMVRPLWQVRSSDSGCACPGPQLPLLYWRLRRPPAGR